jgi:hypothetical protein
MLNYYFNAMLYVHLSNLEVYFPFVFMEGSMAISFFEEFIHVFAD